MSAHTNFVNFATLQWSEQIIQVFREVDILRNDMYRFIYRPGAAQVMFPIFDDVPGGAQGLHSPGKAGGTTPTSAIDTLDTTDLYEDVILYDDIATYGSYTVQGRSESLSNQMAQHQLRKKVIALAKAAIAAGNTTTLTTTNPGTYATSFASASATLRNRHVTGTRLYGVSSPSFFTNLKLNNFVTSTLYNSDQTAGNMAMPGEYVKFENVELWQAGGVFGQDWTSTDTDKKEIFDSKYHYDLTSYNVVIWSERSFGVQEVLPITTRIDDTPYLHGFHLQCFTRNGNVAILTDGMQAL